jgi:Phospholipase_D-nuclease N-terminal
MSFWDIVWFILITYAFVAYLMVMFTIIVDVFRDPDSSGLAKAVWIAALIFFPLISAVLYLVTKGKAMGERHQRAAQSAQQQQEAYIRDVATTTTPADQIAQARTMLDDGVISPAEFDRIKEKALA